MEDLGLSAQEASEAALDYMADRLKKVLHQIEALNVKVKPAFH